MNILFTCAGRRNYLINYFKEALNGAGMIFATDMQDTAPALIDADVGIQVPAIYSSDYISTLLEIIERNRILAVISLNDLELPVLIKAKSQIESKGAQLLISSDQVIDITLDKLRTFTFLESIGINTPKTFVDLATAKEALNSGDIKFPLVVKPRWGSASIQVDFPESMRELELSYELQRIRLERTILSEISKSDASKAILIQEKINGDEYGMDILNDLRGNYVGTFVRRKMQMRSGETDKAMSIIDSRFDIIGEVISRELRHIGNLDCDVFVANGKLYVLELNPRFGGGYPFSHEAGMNSAAAYIAWLKGNNDVSMFNKYRQGLMFSKCDYLMRLK